MYDFRGRKVVVTGGSRGIGRAIAARFLDAGAHVSVCGRKRDALDAFARETPASERLHTAVCDVGNGVTIASYVASAAAALRGIDILARLQPLQKNAAISVWFECRRTSL